jgi:hypothetical protein
VGELLSAKAVGDAGRLGAAVPELVESGEQALGVCAGVVAPGG